MVGPGAGVLGEPSFWERRKIAWADGPIWDLIVGLMVVGLWFLLCSLIDRPQLLTGVAPEARRAIFQTIATVSGTMAGLVFTSVSIMINIIKTPMAILDNLLVGSEKHSIGDRFLAALPKLLWTLSFSLVTLGVESTKTVGWWPIELVTLTLAVASISAVSRVVWILKKLLKIS